MVCTGPVWWRYWSFWCSLCGTDDGPGWPVFGRDDGPSGRVCGDGGHGCPVGLKKIYFLPVCCMVEMLVLVDWCVVELMFPVFYCVVEMMVLVVQCVVELP